MPESKYPPDTLHLSLLNLRSSSVALRFLTTVASSCRTAGGGEGERKGENDRSSGMPVVAIEKLLIRDTRREIQLPRKFDRSAGRR